MSARRDRGRHPPDDQGSCGLKRRRIHYLRWLDIGDACDIAHQHQVQVVVDNTFATPFLQRPLELGADIVVHSTTKYLGGHSDVVGGAVITSREDAFNQLKFLQNAIGAIPGPLDCFLVLRGTKTLAVRMKEHCTNAMAVARFLKDHPEVDQVLYPGLESHPGHAICGSPDVRIRGGGVAGAERRVRAQHALRHENQGVFLG